MCLVPMMATGLGFAGMNTGVTARRRPSHAALSSPYTLHMPMKTFMDTGMMYLVRRDPKVAEEPEETLPATCATSANELDS